MPNEKAVSVSDQIKEKDFPLIAESVIQAWKDRKKRRDPLEKQWDEIDRQLRMEPELSHKTDSAGRKIKELEWLPEVELPLQTQTLEMLTSDIRRLMFPVNRPFWQSRAALTDQYLDRYNRAGSPFPGERAKKGEDPHSILNQDNADQLASAMLAHWHAQYDFRGHFDQINAQTVTYGFGVGRLRKVKRRILGYDARIGGPINQKIPVVVPRNVRKVYLDDSMHSLMHEGYTLGPNIIQERTMNYADLVAAAKDGGNDPQDEDGGYLLSEIKKLSPKKDGTVDLVELEGDLIVDRSDSTVIINDVVVTAAVGGAKNAKDVSAFVRYRVGEKFSTYFVQHYHLEGTDFVNGASPLLKGMPIAKLAAQCMNRIIESGQLKNSPPVGWDREDSALAASGGPRIKPYALWETADLNAIKVYVEVGGDPAVLWQIFVGLSALYADMTGITPPRLGAQTKSHTTAFAKDAELVQGAVRTVDFVNSALDGPMTRLLHLEYRMGLSAMRGRHTVYVQPWDEFVSVTRQHLPDVVRFKAIGSGAPAEDQVKQTQRLQSAQLAMQLDQVAREAGHQPSLDVPALIRRVLSDGGWTDVGEIVTTGTGATPAVAGDQLPGAFTEPPGVLTP